MSLHIKKELGRGYSEIIGPDDGNLEFIELGVLRLSDGEVFTEETRSKEAVLVILSGRCSIRVGEETFETIGERQDVFSGEAYSLYIPYGMSYEVVGRGSVEIAICQAPSDLEGEVKLITPESVKVRSVGRLNWRRDIRDIVDMNVRTRRLIVGETVNPPGNWSSAPPHRHDLDNLPEESDMEEVYFFKVSPPQGFGLQRVYTDDRSVDEVYAVENDDTVVIPEGYHPVVAAPGYRLYYLWVLAGEKRILRPKDDPNHAWLKAAEPMLEHN